MKSFKMFVITAMLATFATASFAGDCCKKGKCEPKDGKPKTETKQEAPAK